MEHDDLLLLAALLCAGLLRGPALRVDRLRLEHLRLALGACFVLHKLLQAARDTLLLSVALEARRVRGLVAAFRWSVLRDAVCGTHAATTRRVLRVQTLLCLAVRACGHLLDILDSFGGLLGGERSVASCKNLFGLVRRPAAQLLLGLLDLNI